MTKSQFARYKVTFTNTRAFLVIEELSAAVADLITGKDEGIIAQQVDNPDLARVLGLNVPELHGELKCMSVHPSNNDIVIVYAQEEPFFESIV
jgi:hypothetical protein